MKQGVQRPGGSRYAGMLNDMHSGRGIGQSHACSHTLNNLNDYRARSHSIGELLAPCKSIPYSTGGPQSPAIADKKDCQVFGVRPQVDGAQADGAAFAGANRSDEKLFATFALEAQPPAWAA